jgi:hypothetical protein
LHIHRVSFEREFEILSEMWAAVVDLRGATLAMRPIVGFDDPNKSEEEVKKERLERFNESYDKCFSLIEKKRPFYPEEIYKALTGIMQIAIDEVRQSQLFGYKPEYYKLAMQNAQAIINGIEDVCKAIRKRIMAHSGSASTRN